MVAVEAESPGIPQPVAPDLGRVRRCGPTKGLSAGMAYGAAVADVQSENGAEQIRQVLAPALRIAARSAVAQTEVEVAVGAEEQLAAVMVVERLLRGEDELSESGSAQVGIAGRPEEGRYRVLPAASV